MERWLVEKRSAERKWSAQLIGIGCVLFFLAGNATPQMPEGLGQGLSDLPRLKSYTAHRASSQNRYVGSNDDSKRIMPGETLAMADLTGPGVVSHIWLTVADNEYAWPRLVRLRVYYDGKKTPSVDVPLGDFFGCETAWTNSCCAPGHRSCRGSSPMKANAR